MEEVKLKISGGDLERARATLEAEDVKMRFQPLGPWTRGDKDDQIKTVPTRLGVTFVSPNEKTALDYVRDLLKDLPDDYDVTRRH